MYVAQPFRFSPEECDAFLVASKKVDIAPGPNGSRISDPVTTAAFCASLLPEFCEGWARITLIVLYPSSQIVAHQDAPIPWRRQHIPLTVNAGCWAFHGGDWQHLERGQCYEMDPTVVHGAVNWGTTVRMHLIVDRERS